MNKRTHLFGIMAFIAAGSLAPVARATPPIIYDSGRTQPIAPYLREAFGQPQNRGEAPAKTLSPPQIDPRAFGLPVRTPELTPGHVLSRRLKHAPPRPLCLLGSDPRSRRWLVRYRDRLRAVGAVCLLVNVDAPKALQAIKQLAKGVPVLPASGAVIARQLGLKHYPVLVSRQGGIEQ